MKRREFIGLLGGAAAAWPVSTRAQQLPMPLVGFLNPASADVIAGRMRSFARGLRDTGYVEGENVEIIYRWAEGQDDRLPALAADLVRRRVAVIAATNTPSAPVALAATSTIPIIFAVADDPVKLGLVASLARPGGNASGINFFNSELAAKRLELLHALTPAAKRVAVLVNPDRPTADTTVRDVKIAAQAMGLQIQILNASNSADLDSAFGIVGRERPDALLVANDGLFIRRRVQLVHLASRYAIPAIFHSREIAEVGGLMTYGTDIADAFRQAGGYVGRVLKGEKPTDMPVIQSTKFELVINAQTARTLGLTIPPTLLAIADEVIE
jgi:putative ABC transport system substrate-binding protein